MQLFGYAKRRKRKNKHIINKLIFLIGLTLSCYPIISNKLVQKQQASLLSTYRESIQKENQRVWKMRKIKAQEYNKMIWMQQNHLEFEQVEMELEDYETLLKTKDSDIMACVEIPSIGVRLPIYHGTTQEVLSEGVGHLEGTSLPVGGKNTHCILTGHRGLPRAKLFVRLDEIEKGEYFFIESCRKKLVYQVKQIQVIEPQEVEKLSIIPNKDLVSLVTCTPYGINTKRLVVTGERVKKQAEKQIEKRKIPSLRECLFHVLPVFFCVIAFRTIVKGRRRKTNEKEKY